MKTGDRVTDAQGTPWTIGQELGRGVWGRTWLVRDPVGGERVLKVALTEADFGEDAPADLAEVCRACLDEQAEALRSPAWSAPTLHDVIGLPDGGRGLLLDRYPGTLDRRLPTMHVERLLDLAARVTGMLQQSNTLHGALRPSNVLIDVDGNPVLSDVLTRSSKARRHDLLQQAPHVAAIWPPEASVAPTPGWDTWAVCAWLFAAAAQREPVPHGRSSTPAPFVGPPAEGLTKVELAEIQDRVLARLDAEGANPRFQARVGARLGAILNRGLSRETEPSPPYRFRKPADLETRLREVTALVRPRITSVGKVILSTAARDGVFEGGGAAELSVAAACSTNEAAHDDLVVGFRLANLDDPEHDKVAVPDASYDVRAHPSGRLRYDFVLPGLPPGRYEIRVAFAVKDAGAEPVLAEGRFEVRPPPGYVPPVERAPAAPSPLQFPRHAASDAEDFPDEPSEEIDPSSPDATVDWGAEGPAGTLDASLKRSMLDAVPTSDPDDLVPRPVAPPSEPFTDPDVSLPRAEAEPEPEPAAAPQAAVATPQGPGTWEPLPSPEPPSYESAVQGGLPPARDLGEDLPTWERGPANGLPEPLGRLIDVLRQNTYVAFIAIVGVLLLFLLVAGIALRTCG